MCQAVDRPTTHYTIARDGEAAEVDLCAEHGAPLDELFPAPVLAPVPPVKRAAPARKAPAKKAAPRRRGAKVVSLDEIERMKQG
ncbi:hypothetical protein KGG70_gp51 [Streptomyces phage Celia]|uniref:Uncharacterized protein n=1 Tax=Streptomyces phage Celia TaxID=2590946 RepID=A0A516KRG6_9CAUD|nr:hypothetical protein KGG70_gp51 [Streptomyces phage Celia]QDP44233.1 DNA binding protein [Streptomyces phage Celia]